MSEAKGRPGIRNRDAAQGSVREHQPTLNPGTDSTRTGAGGGLEGCRKPGGALQDVRAMPPFARTGLQLRQSARQGRVPGRKKQLNQQVLCLLADCDRLRSWCRGEDLNLHGSYLPPAPEAGASTNSATSASARDRKASLPPIAEREIYLHARAIVNACSRLEGI